MAARLHFLAPQLRRIELLVSLQRFVEAERLVREVLTQEPGNARALGWLGVCLLNQERQVEALQALRQAIATNPVDAMLHAWLAEAYIATKDLLAARSAIKEALRLAPEQAAFHGILSMVLLHQMRPQQALRTARAGLALNPEQKQCLTVQARALTILGQADMGTELLAPALASDPTDAFTHANQGFNYLESGNFRAAQTHFLTALHQQPGNVQIRQGLVEALKSSFWFYRSIRQIVQLFFRGLHATGLFRLEADVRKILFYILQIPFLFFTWGWAFQHGFFSNISWFFVGLRLLLLTPLGVLLVLALAGTLLQGLMLTLLRRNPLARPYLSGREVFISNCFLAGLSVLLVGLSARYVGFLR